MKGRNLPSTAIGICLIIGISIFSPGHTRGNSSSDDKGPFGIDDTGNLCFWEERHKSIRLDLKGTGLAGKETKTCARKLTSRVPQGIKLVLKSISSTKLIPMPFTRKDGASYNSFQHDENSEKNRSTIKITEFFHGACHFFCR